MSSLKAIIIGATSGIGEALAKELANRGYIVGITGRRVERLKNLSNALPNRHLREMDVVNVSESLQQLQSLIEEMGGMDVLVLNAGVGYTSPKSHQIDQTIDINTRAFVHLAEFGYNYFKINQIDGRIVGISSVAMHRGTAYASVYSGSKAFISNYMQGLRQQAIIENTNISVTDIRPGFVDTEMTKGQKGMFWVATAEKAARQINDAFERRGKVAYITKRWRFVAWLMANLPDVILNGIMKKNIQKK